MQEFIHRSQNLLGFRVVSPSWTPAQHVRLKEVHQLPAQEYQVIATKEQPEVTVRSGDVTTTIVRDGPVATIRVVAKEEKSTTYSLLVRVAGQPERVVTDTLLHTNWDVKFYAGTKPVIHREILLAGTLVGSQSGNLLTSLVTAGAASAAAPLLQGRMPSLDFDWKLDSPGLNVPANHFALVATADVDVSPEAAGDYRFSARVDDGVRVFVDDVFVLQATRVEPAGLVFATVPLTAGKRRLRLEYGEHNGPAELRFRMTKLRKAPSSHPSTVPVEVLRGEQNIRTEATFDVVGSGPFEIKDITGDITVTPQKGKAPATLQVTGRDLHAQPFAFTIEHSQGDKRSKEQVHVWGTFAPGQLHVQPMRVNALGMRFSLIPEGAFLRGSPQVEIDRVLARFANTPHPPYMALIASECPQHRVQISRPFGMAVHEVTVGQFRRFVNDTRFVTQAERDGGDIANFIDGNWRALSKGYSWSDPYNTRSEDHPAVQLTWNDARAFCEWLSKQDRIAYRLPTEAEWEYACRAGTSSRWFFGDDVDAMGDYVWHLHNSEKRTQPVGRKKPNSWGLHDVYGNAREWCFDCWDARLYARRESKDPTGPEPDPVSQRYRVARGGHLADALDDCRSAIRGYDAVQGSQNLLGFRVASAAWIPSLHVRLKEVRHLPAQEYQVFGGKEQPEVAVHSGDVSTTLRREGALSHLLVVSKDEKPTDYSLHLSAPGTAHKVTVADTLLRTNWDVQFHARPNRLTRRAPLLAGTFVGSRSENLLTAIVALGAVSQVAEAPPDPGAPTDAEWKTMLTGPPLLRERVPQLDYDWKLDAPGPNVPANHFALVATTEVEVSPAAEGEYRLAVSIDEGVRVHLDDVPVLDAWVGGPARWETTTVRLKAGKHRLRVEYFEGTGLASLRFRMSRMGALTKVP